jgi:hypothetical protein
VSPDRKAEINGHLVHEYYWAGELVVYLDNVLQRGKTFEQVCEELREPAA